VFGGARVLVRLADRVTVSANDVLKGKADVAGLESRYVFVVGTGFHFLEKVVGAANVMAKFGWRARGMTDEGILMERQDEAVR
jgi:hypothetical protein